jgi:hypothetical protein
MTSAGISRATNGSCATEVPMSQPLSTPAPNTVSTPTPASVSPPVRVRTRAARLRQISLFGLASGVALASVRAPAAVIVPVMIVVLAGIDIVGGVVAKSWALGRSPWAFVAGVSLFALLFWIYGLSLRHGELSTITIGWVVLVTLADMGLDRFYYDVHFPLPKWLAAFAAVGLLAYLLIGPNGSTPKPDPHAPIAKQDHGTSAR